MTDAASSEWTDEDRDRVADALKRAWMSVDWPGEMGTGEEVVGPTELAQLVRLLRAEMR